MSTFNIGQHEFTSKAVAQARVSEILGRYEVGYTVDQPEDVELLSSLALTHVWHRSIVGVGIHHFEVGYKPPFYNSRTFKVVRTDGTVTYLAVTRYFQNRNKNKAEVFRAKCRLAIKPQLDQFRRQFFARPGRHICALTGVTITPRTTHVDHIVPFEDLILQWEARTNKDYKAKSIKAFAEWHGGVAELRCVHKDANLKRGRPDGEQ